MLKQCMLFCCLAVSLECGGIYGDAPSANMGK